MRPVTGAQAAKITIIEFSGPSVFVLLARRADDRADQSGPTPRTSASPSSTTPPFHPQAAPASRAAMAAREQGDDKFWAYHRKLFEGQQTLDDQHFEQWARELGLNVDKWKNDMAQNRARYDQQIQADQAEAAKYGARGTPAFFINGRPLSGAQPFDAFQKVIDEEIGVAEKALRAGAKPESLYATLIPECQGWRGRSRGPKPPPFQLPDPKIVYKVMPGNSPQKGPAGAKVTIIEFSDFQCPFCSRVVPTLKKLHETYPNDVRVIFKHNPLSFHEDANLAAQATIAAEEQGKFWEMHDKLFETSAPQAPRS